MQLSSYGYTREFAKHERSVRVARGYRNSSFFLIPQFLEERKLWEPYISKFYKISYREFSFYLVFVPKIPEFSVEWFGFRRLKYFRIFQEIFVPFAADSNVPELLVECKVPILSVSFIFVAETVRRLE